MTDHTDEPVERPTDRTLTWWPIAGAAIIAALVAVAIFSFGAGEDNRTGSKVEGDGALSCPTGYLRSKSDGNDRVPADPSGVDGQAALVPDVAPRHVAVCRYQPAPETEKQDVDLPLDGRAVLESGQRAAAAELSRATKSTGPRVCTQQLVRDQPSYLVGFTFSTGVVWVSVPGDRCVPSSNGQFATDVNLRPDVAAAFTSKTWPAA